MKKVWFMLAMMICIFASCSDGGGEEPITPTPKPEEVKTEITIDSGIISNGLSFDSTGGEQSVSFSVNADWTLSIASTTSGATWCKASATSGSKGTANVKFTVSENTDYEDRSVSVTIKAGTASKTFTITQKGADAMLVTTTKYEVAQEGGQIEIEVKANIDYKMEISDEAKNWIKESSSRALTTYKHKLDIAMNEDAEKREGEITFKSGDKVETVKVYQAGGTILLLSQNEYTVSDAGGTISVDIKSNINFGVQMPDVDWIVDEASSRGLSSHTLKYVIKANEGFDSRSAEIIFYDKNSDLKDTLKVVQAQKDAIVLANHNYNFDSKGGNLTLYLSANIDFDHRTDVSWIKEDKTRGLKDFNIKFTIEENKTHTMRIGKIYFFNSKKNLKDSIVITQSGITYKDNNWDGTVATSFQSGTGSTDDPYLIATCAQMQKIAYDVSKGSHYKNKHFKLIANLSFNNLEQLSIGSESQPFQGYFDGNGCEISNFKQSLFNYIFDTNLNDNFKTGIRNLILKGNTPTEDVPLCKYNKRAIVENCKNEANLKLIPITKSIYNIGCFVGSNDEGEIINCINKGNISIHFKQGEGFNFPTHIGGICGYNKGVVKECINKGNIKSQGLYVGGIVGYSDLNSVIRFCSNYGEIQGSNSTAGIVGLGTNISYCINWGKIETLLVDTGNHNMDVISTIAAGICAHLAGNISYCKNIGDIYSYTFIGGICGYLYYGHIDNTINQGNILSVEEKYPLNHAGGIVGHINSERGYVNSSYTVARIDETKLYTGAICGNNNGSVTNCFWLDNKVNTRGIGVDGGYSYKINYFKANKHTCEIYISENESEDLIKALGSIDNYKYSNSYNKDFVLPEFTIQYFDK